MGNLQDTLEKLALEPERVAVHELARNEFDRIPQLLNDFIFGLNFKVTTLYFIP